MDLSLAATIVGAAILVTLVVLLAALVLGGALWLLLARAGVARPGPEPLLVRAGTWAFAGFFALNSLGNLASRSRAERLAMTPLAALLALSFARVASG